jgi:hypothetical protein
LGQQDNLMSVIDMHTSGDEVGTIKLPMRRVTGSEEWRVRAWIELTTFLAEWPTDEESGLDYQAIFDGATDDEIIENVTERLLTVPATDTVGPVVITRDNDTATMTISITAKHDGTTTTLEIGA